MDNKDSEIVHKCNICNKIYASYKNLCNHNKIKHNTEEIPIDVKPVEDKPVKMKKAKEVKSIEDKPLEVKPVKMKKLKEVKSIEDKPVEVKHVEDKPVEVKPVEVKPIKMKKSKEDKQVEDKLENKIKKESKKNKQLIDSANHFDDLNNKLLQIKMEKIKSELIKMKTINSIQNRIELTDCYDSLQIKIEQLNATQMKIENYETNETKIVRFDSPERIFNIVPNQKIFDIVEYLENQEEFNENNDACVYDKESEYTITYNSRKLLSVVILNMINKIIDAKKIIDFTNIKNMEDITRIRNIIDTKYEQDKDAINKEVVTKFIIYTSLSDLKYYICFNEAIFILLTPLKI
jgi:hypothetical protein